MSKLTTHVLDLSHGGPAAGIRIELHSLIGGVQQPLAEQMTGSDGRCSAPLLEGDGLRCGQYMLTFHLADYFRSRGVTLPEPPFLDRAVVHIGIAEPTQHYHVPLLIAPWSYSVYRGG
jgi:5-hydroxyisourate hydrolase